MSLIPICKIFSLSVSYGLIHGYISLLLKTKTFLVSESNLGAQAIWKYDFLKIKSFLDVCGEEMSKEWSCTDKSKDEEHQMACY